jgi:hypothetical protein
VKLAGSSEERLRLRVAPATLHSFVKVRAKHGKRTQFELPAVEVTAAGVPDLDRVAALKASHTQAVFGPCKALEVLAGCYQAVPGSLLCFRPPTPSLPD